MAHEGEVAEATPVRFSSNWIIRMFPTDTPAEYPPSKHQT